MAVGERPLKERKSRSLVPDPRAASLQEQLTDLLDTKVQVTIGKARGKIVIDFGDGDDLDRVLNAMGIAQSLEL